MNNYLSYTLIVILLLISNSSNAQNESTLIEDSVINVSSGNDLVWDMSFELKTMNVFRGLLPSNAITYSSQLGVKYKCWILGFYGGASTSGIYTETDLILIYYKPRFNARLDWYYNFTKGITNIPNPSGIFDFDPETTRGLLDFILNYDLNKHIRLTSSTFVFGRDRPSLPEDDANDILLRRGDQRYTQYLGVYYNWNWDKAKVTAHAAGTFSLDDPSGPSFYGERAGFTDVGITFKRKLFDTENVSIPIKASVTANAVTNNVFMVVGIQLLEISRIK